MTAALGELDVAAVRRQFPALSRRVGDHPAAFLDGPAGSQVPQSVIDAMADYMGNCNANGGGAFATSRESDQRIAAAQETVATFLGASDVNAVAFGANMTTLTFALSRSLAKTWTAGDEVVVTRLDHDANITPWTSAAADVGAVVRQVPFNPRDTTLDVDAFATMIGDRTRLVAFAAAANSTGTVNDIKKLTELAHARGADVFVDAVHYAPHRLPDVLDWGCDFMACSAYKFFGPHIGMLWGCSPRFAELPTYNVRPVDGKMPWRWMTGTTNAEGVCGTAAAIDYLASLGQGANLRKRLESAYDRIAAHENALTRRLLDGLAAIDAVTVWGITDRERANERVATIAITHATQSSSSLAQHLGENGVFVWAGHFYATTVTADLGLDPEGLVRIGLLHYNTTAEVDRLLSLLAAL